MWRLNVATLSHSLMLAGKELQVDGTATEKARRACSLCVRGTTSSGASDERRARVGTWVCTRSLRYARVAVAAPLSQYSHLVGDPLPHWKPVERPEQRLGVGATPALADDSG